MSETTGQQIRAALNDRIAALQATVTDIEGAERIDALAEFRVEVNAILHAAGELDAL